MRPYLIIASLFLSLCVVFAVGAVVIIPPLMEAGAAVGVSDYSADATVSFDSKIAGAQATATAAAQSGKAAPIEITFTEEEMTADAGRYLAEGNDTAGFTVSDILVKLRDQLVYMQVKVNLGGLPAPVLTKARPVVKDGKVKSEVVGMEFAGVQLPGAIRNQMSSAVEKQLNAMWDTLPLYVQEVIVGEGVITYKGVSKK